jgi:hypothetical protein
MAQASSRLSLTFPSEIRHAGSTIFTVVLVVGWAGVAGRAVLHHVAISSKWGRIVALARRKGVQFRRVVGHLRARTLMTRVVPCRIQARLLETPCLWGALRLSSFPPIY